VLHFLNLKKEYGRYSQISKPTLSKTEPTLYEINIITFSFELIYSINDEKYNLMSYRVMLFGFL